MCTKEVMAQVIEVKAIAAQIRDEQHEIRKEQHEFRKEQHEIRLLLRALLQSRPDSSRNSQDHLNSSYNFSIFSLQLILNGQLATQTQPRSMRPWPPDLSIMRDNKLSHIVLRYIRDGLVDVEYAASNRIQKEVQ